MFNDYYAILEIEPSSSKSDILIAFKKQTLKWHPDRNPHTDTTEKMRLVIEAKLILTDEVARKKYDLEYLRYKQKIDEEQSRSFTKSGDKSSDGYGYDESNGEKDSRKFDIRDEELKRWMNNAQKQSKDLLHQTIEDFKGMVKVGAKAALETGVQTFLTQIALGIFILVILTLAKLCN